MSIKEPFPEKAEDLVREVDATIKIKDIKEIYRLKDIISIKWWETALVLLLFFSGTGFLITLSQLNYLFPPEKSIVLTFILFWFIILMFILIATVEFLINKIKALRKLYEVQTKVISILQNEVDKMKSEFDAIQKSPEDDANKKEKKM